MESPLLRKPTKTLNSSVYQWLHILQLPLGDLEYYLTIQSDTNPLVTIQSPEKAMLFQEVREKEWVGSGIWKESTFWNCNNYWYQEELRGWSKESTPPLHQIYKQNPKTFTQHLIDQLRQDRLIPSEYLPHCIFVAESLDSRGYFVDDLQQTADLLKISYSTMEQVLFMVQEMHPIGVAARNLQECLLLQLVKSPYYNDKTLVLISKDWEELEQLDLDSLATDLDTTVAEAQRYWQMVRGFNPFPIRAYLAQQKVSYLIPEAMVTVEDEQLKIVYHSEGCPQIVVDTPETENNSILASYLQINQKSAQETIEAMKKRRETLELIITYIVTMQQKFFMDKENKLEPLSIAKIANSLQLHPTWVSRGVCDKYIYTPHGLLSLKSLLSASDEHEDLELLYRDSIHSRIRVLVAGEDKTAPLSDAKMQKMLEGFSIHISRRTIAKYRDQMKIPNASLRKVKQ